MENDTKTGSVSVAYALFDFQVKMLTVLPAFRRMGLAVMLTEKSMAQAKDQGFKVIRMDCINPYE